MEKTRQFIKSRKAQSFLEYSLLIVLAVGVLLGMRVYMSRSMQGNIKQTVDRLGSEKVGIEQFSPGGWFGSEKSSAVTRSSSSGFDFEWGWSVGFGIMTGNSHITHASRITDIVDLSLLSPGDNDLQGSLPDGEDELFVDRVLGSDFNPDMNTVQANINDNVEEWDYGYHGEHRNAEELAGYTGGDFKGEARVISDKYVEDDPAAYLSAQEYQDYLEGNQQYQNTQNTQEQELNIENRRYSQEHDINEQNQQYVEYYGIGQ